MKVSVELTGKIFHFRGQHLAEWAGVDEEGGAIRLFTACVMCSREAVWLPKMEVFTQVGSNVLAPCEESSNGG